MQTELIGVDTGHSKDHTGCVIIDNGIITYSGDYDRLYPEKTEKGQIVYETVLSLLLLIFHFTNQMKSDKEISHEK